MNGRLRPKSFRLAGGERVLADLRAPDDLEPDPTPIAVRYEDPFLLVVSKPDLAKAALKGLGPLEVKEME